MIVFKQSLVEELQAGLADLDVSLKLARRLQSTVLRRDVFPDELPEVSPRLLAEIRQRIQVPRLRLLDKVVSPQDGFAKYLFAGDGVEPFEAVRIPLLHRPEDRKYIVCVSCQVGCALGCAFCATGTLRFRRNLAAWEMVDQVLKIRDDSTYPVRGVVFMGMGEPMLNYDQVMQAARVLSEPCGPAIGAKTITISTAGVVAGIRRFTAEHRPYRLVVSLTSADPEVRRELMPIEKTYPTSELMAALRDYHAATGQRVILAWTMLRGINTRDCDAQMLADLVGDLPIKLNLIDVNDPTGRFTRPSAEELKAFRDALGRHLAAPVVRRYSGGQDIAAACGMLAGRSAKSLSPNLDS